jgi:hypothetical protein
LLTQELCSELGEQKPLELSKQQLSELIKGKIKSANANNKIGFFIIVGGLNCSHSFSQQN